MLISQAAIQYEQTCSLQLTDYVYYIIVPYKFHPGSIWVPLETHEASNEERLLYFSLSFLFLFYLLYYYFILF